MARTINWRAIAARVGPTLFVLGVAAGSVEAQPSRTATSAAIAAVTVHGPPADPWTCTLTANPGGLHHRCQLDGAETSAPCQQAGVADLSGDGVPETVFACGIATRVPALAVVSATQVSAFPVGDSCATLDARFVDAVEDDALELFVRCVYPVEGDASGGATLVLKWRESALVSVFDGRFYCDDTRGRCTGVESVELVDNGTSFDVLALPASGGRARPVRWRWDAGSFRFVSGRIRRRRPRVASSPPTIEPQPATGSTTITVDLPDEGDGTLDRVTLDVVAGQPVGGRAGMHQEVVCERVAVVDVAPAPGAEVVTLCIPELEGQALVAVTSAAGQLLSVGAATGYANGYGVRPMDVVPSGGVELITTGSMSGTADDAPPGPVWREWRVLAWVGGRLQPVLTHRVSCDENTRNGCGEVGFSGLGGEATIRFVPMRGRAGQRAFRWAATAGRFVVAPPTN